MMGIFKIFSSDSTLNVHHPTPMPSSYTQQYSSSETTSSDQLTSSTSITSISDQISLGSTNSNEKIITDTTTQNIIIEETSSSKEILFGSGDGSPETTTEYNNKKQAYAIREKELIAQIENERHFSQQSCEIIKEFETILTNVIQERDQIIEHKDIALVHLSNIEYAFYDVTTKYERAKSICEQYRENEQILTNTLQNAERLLQQRAHKYEILKRHANDKLTEANIEIDKLRKTYTLEVAKLNAVIKKSECKVKCLEQQLEQKIAENMQMARLWEDLNNNIQNENYPN